MKTVSNKVKRFLAMLMAMVMAFDMMPAAAIAAPQDEAAEGAAVSEEAGGVEPNEAGNYLVGIGGEDFSTEKMIIDLVGGTAYYEPGTNTVTLSANEGEKITGIVDPEANDVHLISCGYPDVLTVRGAGELSHYKAVYGIISEGDIVTDGDITVSAPRYPVNSSGSVLIKGSLKSKVLTADHPAILAAEKLTINGRLEAENACAGIAVIEGWGGIEISGENAYVHIKAVSDNSPFFLTGESSGLTLGKNIFVTEPAGGRVSENRSYGYSEYFVTDQQGNIVKEATIQYVPQSYTVSFNMSGKDATNVPLTQTVPENGYAVRPATDPKAEGFDFAGWCADKECTKEFDFANTKISENKIVYAKWTEAEPEPVTEPVTEPETGTETGKEDEAVTYTVSFNMSGKDATNVPAAQTVSKNGLATRPASDPKAEGFVFAGWYADAAFAKEYTFTEPVTADIMVYAKWDEDLTIVDKYPTSWNLFENADEHVFKLNGVSTNKAVENSNTKSSAFYTATLEGSEIRVVLKKDVKRKNAAKTANSMLEFNLGDQGVVEYALPVQYVKPVLKLEKTSAPIVGGKAGTKVLRKASTNIFEPFDISDAILTYSKGGNVSGNEAGGLIINNAAKSKGKISITKAGWAEEIKLKFTVKAAVNVYADLGNLKTVVVNKNAPEQKQVFDLYANGTVEIKDKKNTGLITVTDNKLIIAYKAGVKKGTYKIKLAVGKSSQTINVKVSERDLTDSVKLRVKSKFDVVTKQKMVLVPDFKEASGKILAVSSNDAAYIVSINEAGNIVADYKENDITIKRLGMKDMSLKLTIEGINTPVNVTVKMIKAKMTTPKVTAVTVVIPKGAEGRANSAVANIVCSYKDSAKMYHEITPEKLEIAPKNCKAELKDKDTAHVYISDLSSKTGSVKVTAHFAGDAKKTGTIKLKWSK